MTSTIAMVRHGETDWNRERRFQGHADPPLNGAGRAQVLELGDCLNGHRFGAVYSSPLLRALETATILASGFGLAVEVSEPLREIDVGSWQGLTVTEVEARFPDGYRRWTEWQTGWEGGETYEELGLRVVPALSELAARHRGEQILAVTHGGPIRSCLAAASGLSFSEARARIGVLDNCAVVRFAIGEGIFEQVD